MDDSRKVLLGVASQSEAQRLQLLLSKNDIAIALVHNAQTCKSGCSIQLEMWAHPDDIDHIKSTLASEWHSSVTDLGYDAKLADAVFNPEAAEATCPACGMLFSTSVSSCPDCGLEFSLPNTDAAPSNCGPGNKCK